MKKKNEERPKIIYDAFTIPEKDHAIIGKSQARARKVGVSASKSEIVRAGLIALDAMSDSSFARAIGRVERIKTGRPKKR